MPDIYVYDTDDDTTTIGLVGALFPTACEYEENDNGLESVTMEHPFDPLGKWKALENGRLLLVPVRKRTPPEISEGGQYVTEVEQWTINDTATASELAVYTKEKKNKKKGKLIPGRTVIVLAKGEERYKVKYEKLQNKKKQKYVWLTGWVAEVALKYDTVTQVPENSSNLETLCPSGDAIPQLFRIQSIKKSVENQSITVTAVHIGYDLSRFITTYQNDAPLNGITALSGIKEGIEQDNDFSFYTDCGNTRTSCDWEDATVTNALLDPDNGFCSRWNTTILRDNYDLYFLNNAGMNRGIRIEHKKNLTGAELEIDESDIVTAIKPRGVKKDGSMLYLTDDGNDSGSTSKSAYASDGERSTPAEVGDIIEIEDEDGSIIQATVSGNYVLSPNFSTYGWRCSVLDCDDCTVEKGKKGVTLELARNRMIKQAKAQFEDEEVDQPEIKMTVNFIELGRTEEYKYYKELESAYMHDTVIVAAKEYGIEVRATVTRLVYDVLADRVTEVDLGNVKLTNKIYSWQLPTITGGMLAPNIQDNETPVVQISGSSFVISANQNGQCSEASADYKITARVGYRSVEPVIGDLVGLPTGMILKYKETEDTGIVKLTLYVAEGETLGSDEQLSGQITVPVTYPVTEDLTISWAKINQGTDGVDGTAQQFVFKRTETQDVPSIDNAPNQDPVYVPDGWTASPTGITEEIQYEWVAIRDKFNGEWGGFGVPVLWAMWGRVGRDGDGVEYIYKLTETESPPELDITQVSQEDEYIPEGWMDNPTGVNIEYRYEWVSVRKKTGGLWGAYCEPALWAKYGRDGGSTEYIYARSITENAPSLVSGDIDYGSTPVDQDGFVPSGWTSDPTGVDETRQYEWVSKRDKVNGEWGVFSWPALWSKYGQNGESISGAFASPALMTFTANSNGVVSATERKIYVYAMTGTLHVVPEIQTITGLPSGMSYTQGELTEDNEIPIVFSVSNGSNLGGAGNQNGIIYIPVTSPVTTTLYVAWSKICDGAQGPQGSQGVPGDDGTYLYYQSSRPSNGSEGDTWINSSTGAIYRHNGSSWVQIQLQSEAFAANSITTSKIVAGAITSGKLSANSVSSYNIIGGTITSAELSSGCITTDKLASSSVTADKLNVSDLYVSRIYSQSYSSFNAVVGSQYVSGYGSIPGIHFQYYGSTVGGLYTADGAVCLYGTLNSPVSLMFSAAGGSAFVGQHETSGAYGWIYDCDLLPRIGDLYTLGGNGQEQRWKRLYSNNSVNVSSDRRLKCNIETLNAMWLLKKLLPKRFRMKSDQSKLKFGFIAQDVEEAIQDTDLADAEFFGGDNPDELSLCYEELIAVLVEGWQYHEQRILELESRVQSLEQALSGSDDAI